MSCISTVPISSGLLQWHVQKICKIVSSPLVHIFPEMFQDWVKKYTSKAVNLDG